ncbi:conserved exported hypothetical protein [Candidatus Sulfotelmatomonas gaucii]|uniref:Beta-galactosidase trimerisation domain-containing protein n=1 Tax=Candidatus Sulfuritelmatomonas gaucii TaxID=2043161 RepID=A0A2N9L3E7_9BACT|nr:conserved exported hypothetical protein [Candidatus Sulfotelmatomonas gaucii]
MKLIFIVACLFLAANFASTQSKTNSDLVTQRTEERLSFQSGDPWTPRINLNADVAMAYGIGPRLPSLVQSWRDHGYIVDLMTGSAWGGYQDYLDGKFDGTNHWDQAQTDSAGNHIVHGGNPTVPYISPGAAYGQYLSVGVKRALDLGVQAVSLEEPEFWARSGGEDNFKREWKAYYHEDWEPPDSSPDAQYRASKLKYYLYRRALGQVFDSVAAYGKAHGRTVPCYVATHSLINYSTWRIVSPESSLIGVGTAGYIAQVWTGTARVPNMYDGKLAQRTFETAFLEYGVMQNLVRASGRRIWYLNDPVADSPNNTWDDYRSNWQSTLTASLLQPEVWRYEVMPWPKRVFNGMHPATEEDAEKLRRGSSVNPTGAARTTPPPKLTVPMKGIPPVYATELQTVIAALGDMKQADVRWEVAGTRGAGVLVSDTMMFERAAPQPSDQYLGSFYGLAMPLVMRGVPVDPVQIESATAPGFLSHYKLLFLTYEGQKPPTPEFHAALANWVRNSGALVVVDNDDDPYNAVREWWNTAPNSYKTPREHLFAQLHIPIDGAGLFHVGRGMVLSERVSPAALTYQPDGGDTLRGYARQAAAAAHLRWSETNAFVLRRGPYIVDAGLDEPVPGAAPVMLHGHFVDLFDADLPVLTTVTLTPGTRDLLFDLDYKRTASAMPRVVVAACQVRDVHATARRLTFAAEGIADTNAVVRIQSRLKPTSVSIGGKILSPYDYKFEDGTILLRFANAVDPVPVEVSF